MSGLVLFALSGVAQPCLAAVEAELGVPYGAYTLRLASFSPAPNRDAGVLLKARINGGPLLRLLLDSGAENITIDSRSAARSALSATSGALLAGAGESSTRAIRMGIAESVKAGDLIFRNCRVDVVEGRLAEGVDGVIPLALFSAFLVRLDLPSRTLELVPYTEGTAFNLPGPVSPTLASDLLLARAVLNDAHQGYVLLDTGAAYTAVSTRVADAMHSARASSLRITGANGGLDAGVIGSAVRFQVAGRDLKAQHVLALDLSTMSRYNGVEVIGVLGYPELSHSVLTVSYRDALVRIAAK